MMMTPSVVLLMLWMIVPLGMTLYFSFLRYNLLRPPASFWGWKNYSYFLTDTAFLCLPLSIRFCWCWGVVVISVIGGILLAIVLNKDIWGRGIVRLMVIAPFFIMPTVSALVWKNMFMNPVNGLFGYAAQWLGVTPIDFLAHYPLESIIGIVAWQWLPFATLIFADPLCNRWIKSRWRRQRWTARDIYRGLSILLCPIVARPITVVVLIQTIFLLNIFAEIFVTTSGGPGTASTNLPWLIYRTGRLSNDIGGAAAGGVLAIILANIVAVFLMRLIGKNLDV